MTNSERLDEFSGALLASVLELLAERKVNRPGAALTLSADDLASSWDLVAEAAALPDPPEQPDAGEEVASSYWYERVLGDLLGGDCSSKSGIARFVSRILRPCCERGVGAEASSCRGKGRRRTDANAVPADQDSIQMPLSPGGSLLVGDNESQK